MFLVIVVVVVVVVVVVAVVVVVVVVVFLFLSNANASVRSLQPVILSNVAFKFVFERRKKNKRGPSKKTKSLRLFSQSMRRENINVVKTIRPICITSNTSCFRNQSESRLKI